MLGIKRARVLHEYFAFLLSEIVMSPRVHIYIIRVIKRSRYQ